MGCSKEISCSLFALVCFVFAGCSKSTNFTEAPVRERVVVSGFIIENTVWKSGKDCYVTGDVTVEAGATLTIQPDVVVKFAHERADLLVRRARTQTGDYYGITVEGTLIAGGGDSTTAIVFTPLDMLFYPTGFTSGAAEWARKPGDWRGIEASPLRLKRFHITSMSSSIGWR